MPNIPKDAPFSGSQRMWLDGFFAGLQAQNFGAAAVEESAVAKSVSTMNILYGTQTGNAEALAEDASYIANGLGYKSEVSELDMVDVSLLSKMENLLVVVSTYGEGEMPDNANIFWEALQAETAPRLDNLNYAVLALGDTSYDEFCHAGKLIDMRLEQLGASRLAPRIDCDVDYEDAAAAWLDETIKPPQNSDLELHSGAISSAANHSPNTSKSIFTRKNPFKSNLLDNRLLSGRGSAKEIRHLSFDLAGSDIKYETGDAIGIMPRNAPDLVDDLLARIGATYDDEFSGKDLSLGQILTDTVEVMTPSKDLIQAISERACNAALNQVIDDKEGLDEFLWGKDTLDLLNLNPDLKFDPEEFLSWLRPLQHRAYSISSSPNIVGNEVHLTVAAVRWNPNGREHRGVASTFLADQVNIGQTAGIFLSPNKNFRVPEDNKVPMIMVGPGTGIAPFRAFLQEREYRNSSGMNWLFFGDQHRDTDFLYENELSEMSKSGLLDRLDLAFSRDQQEKIYVQHRMLEQGKDLYAAIQDGGYFYVCGDASKMAKDVDDALCQVVQDHGNMSQELAVEYVNNMKLEKRYLRDVY